MLRKVLLLAALLLLLLLLLLLQHCCFCCNLCNLLIRTGCHSSQLLAHDSSQQELPPGTFTLVTQLQQTFCHSVGCLTSADENRLADEAACSRWMQHAINVICSSGALTMLTILIAT
jgi:hypothetical protein